MADHLHHMSDGLIVIKAWYTDNDIGLPDFLQAL